MKDEEKIKQNFEQWLTDNVDDTIFQETCEQLSQICNINELYKKDYCKLIYLFKLVMNQIIINKYLSWI